MLSVMRCLVEEAGMVGTRSDLRVSECYVLELEEYEGGMRDSPCRLCNSND